MSTISQRTSAAIVAFIAVLLLLPSLTLAAEVTKTVYRIDETYSLFVLPFIFNHDRYTVITPTSAIRDTFASSSLSYTFKTPEGLRVKDGRSAAALTTDSDTGHGVLYVLYEKATSTSRVSTLEVTAFPFGLVTPNGTTTTQLYPHELRKFTLTDKTVERLVDTE